MSAHKVVGGGWKGGQEIEFTMEADHDLESRHYSTGLCWLLSG